jgi:hypothetical protein
MIRLLIAAMSLFYFSNAISQPSVLELKVIQTRVFNVASEKFVSGVSEMCKNYGGSFSPSMPSMAVRFLQMGQLSCIGMKGKYKHIFKIELEGEQNKDLGLVVRMRISDMQNQSYDKKHYDDVAKEISDTIGVQDIPIRLDLVK